MMWACGIAVALGALSVLGFSPFSLYVLPPLALTILIASWRQAASPLQAAAMGFAFGFGLFAAGVSWVYVSMHDFGGMHAGVAALATLLFCAYLALYPALTGFLFSCFKTDSMWRDSLLAAGLWTISEWLRGWVLTGFPWLSLGYAQSPPSPLASVAPVLGVFGISFLSAFLAALLATAWPRRNRILRVAAVIVMTTGLSAGLARLQWTQPTRQELTVSLLQGNIEQSLKWRPELLRRSLDTYMQLAEVNAAHLVVLPETALPTTLDRLPTGYLEALKHRHAPHGVAVLLGIVTSDGKGRYFNSAIGMSRDVQERYSKSHLVPFGEFTPSWLAWTASWMHIPMSNFARGDAAQPPMELAGERIAVNICYEDVFGEEIIRTLPQASLLVNLSNTAWFGNSLAQPQHLQIAQLRALETGRYMLRATNTGMTAVVSPKGIVVAQLTPFTAGVLPATVRGYTGATPYVRWGNSMVLILSTLAIVPGLASAMSRRSIAVRSIE